MAAGSAGLAGEAQATRAPQADASEHYVPMLSPDGDGDGDGDGASDADAGGDGVSAVLRQAASEVWLPGDRDYIAASSSSSSSADGAKPGWHALLRAQPWSREAAAHVFSLGRPLSLPVWRSTSEAATLVNPTDASTLTTGSGTTGTAAVKGSDAAVAATAAPFSYLSQPFHVHTVVGPPSVAQAVAVAIARLESGSATSSGVAGCGAAVSSAASGGASTASSASSASIASSVSAASAVAMPAAASITVMECCHPSLFEHAAAAAAGATGALASRSPTPGHVKSVSGGSEGGPDRPTFTAGVLASGSDRPTFTAAAGTSAGALEPEAAAVREYRRAVAALERAARLTERAEAAGLHLRAATIDDCPAIAANILQIGLLLQRGRAAGGSGTGSGSGGDRHGRRRSSVGGGASVGGPDDAPASTMAPLPAITAAQLAAVQQALDAEDAANGEKPHKRPASLLRAEWAARRVRQLRADAAAGRAYVLTAPESWLAGKGLLPVAAAAAVQRTQARRASIVAMPTGTQAVAGAAGLADAGGSDTKAADGKVGRSPATAAGKVRSESTATSVSQAASRRGSSHGAAALPLLLIEEGSLAERLAARLAMRVEQDARSRASGDVTEASDRAETRSEAGSPATASAAWSRRSSISASMLAVAPGEGDSSLRIAEKSSVGRARLAAMSPLPLHLVSPHGTPVLHATLPAEDQVATQLQVPIALAVIQGRSPYGARVAEMHVARHAQGKSVSPLLAAMMCSKLLVHEGLPSICILSTSSDSVTVHIAARAGFVERGRVSACAILRSDHWGRTGQQQGQGSANRKASCAVQ